ncbi:ABC transporter ATP-binding protein [Planococcus halotolerans]|uniref:Bacitracin ABC transporter ATP-binding protein n=1 Tax=Planococcus halotolerans TaxID=2233542 RepID=A0A365KXF5_9BACL|nr:ABC transporter ATP-binding protein [Planococcus halotolerans]QHJ72151.1 ATP-binding cassette domain-containing protein [Planococcus halotolerans]RAZ77834.1 bacitracin ABC transporter ATP-binding protein [Planococcus halotolerans]
MKTILKAKNVTKTYGKKGTAAYTAISDLSFSMNEGEFIGIMGPSGSGKTTLLNMVATLDPLTDGEITIDGISVSSMNENQLSDFRSQKLGFIFQDFNLLENMTVFENIALPLALQNKKLDKIQASVHQVASLLGISDITEKYPAELSGGQKQRTAIARALIHEPTLLLADEPTGALDSKNAATLLDTLADLNKERKVSILMVTHDPRSASYCSRLLFIKDGKLDHELFSAGTREEFHQEILAVLGDLDRRPVAGVRS